MSGINEQIKMTGHLKIYKNNELIRDVDNLVVTAGKGYVANRMKSDVSGGTAIMSHMAIGSGTTNPAAGDTAPETQLARVALTRYMKRQGRVWTRVFPNIPVSKKPIEVRMGKGKGNPEFFACRVKPGRILFEVDGVSEQIAKEALYKASAKLPIKTKFIRRFA